MCSFYWSHRLRPLQPVIRLQVLYPRSLSPPLLLALPHPHLLQMHRGRYHMPPLMSALGRRFENPLSICCVFLSLWPRCPRYRTYSSPPCSFHLSHLQTQRGYNEPYSEMRAMGQLKRWMIPESPRSLCSDSLLTSTPLPPLLPSSPTWSKSPEGAFWRTAVVISTKGAL